MDRRKIIIGLALAGGAYYLSQGGKAGSTGSILGGLGGSRPKTDIAQRSPISEQGKEIREEVREQMSGSGGSSGSSQSQNWAQIKIVSKNGKPSSYRIDVEGDIRRKSNIESGDEISGGVAEGSTTSKDILEAVGKFKSASISRGTELYVKGELIAEKPPKQTSSQPAGGSSGGGSSGSDSGSDSGSNGIIDRGGINDKEGVSVVDTAEKHAANAVDRGFTFNDDTNLIGQAEEAIDETVGGGFTGNEDTSIVTEAEDAVDTVEETVDKVQDRADAGFTGDDDTNVVDEAGNIIDGTQETVDNTVDNTVEDAQEAVDGGITGDEDTNIFGQAGSLF